MPSFPLVEVIPDIYHCEISDETHVLKLIVSPPPQSSTLEPQTLYFVHTSEGWRLTSPLDSVGHSLPPGFIPVFFSIAVSDHSHIPGFTFDQVDFGGKECRALRLSFGDLETPFNPSYFHNTWAYFVHSDSHRNPSSFWCPVTQECVTATKLDEAFEFVDGILL